LARYGKALPTSAERELAVRRGIKVTCRLEAA
jgi:hypothetical protein